MKITKKIISVILCAVLVFGAALPASYAEDTNSIASVISTEKQALTTTQFIWILKPVRMLLKNLLGKDIFAGNFSIDFREGIALDLCNYIKENSALDIPEFCKNVPLDTTALEVFYKLTNTDTTALREAIREKRRECDQNGEATLSTILYFFENYLSVIKNIEVYTEPYGTDGTERVALNLTRLDGSQEKILADIFFDADGLVHGESSKGLLGIGYECSVYDLLIYATVDCWMRDFGFCYFYDFFCYTTPFFNYNTRRFKFDYAGKEWMVQVWKGNYVITNGAEVGIYNRAKGSIGSYYDCYDGLMNMSLKLSHGDEVIYDISGAHWWLNGFKLGKTLYKPSTLTMEFSIETLDEEMANALADAINNHYMHDTSCVVEGTTVKAVW